MLYDVEQKMNTDDVEAECWRGSWGEFLADNVAGDLDLEEIATDLISTDQSYSGGGAFALTVLRVDRDERNHSSNDRRT